MLRMKETLQKGLSTAKKKKPESNCCINELIERVFTTRNLVHFAHWSTNSYAAHQALGELYEVVVDEVDALVEAYQGEFGLLSGLCCEKCSQPADIVAHIKADSDWVKANRSKIANGSTTIENMVDTVMAAYNTTLYKLKNLH